MFCKSCKYWTRNICSPKEYGNCNCDKIKYEYTKSSTKEQNDKLFYFAINDGTAYLETGEDFGCIHWERIIKPIPELCEICNKNKQNGSVGKLDDPYYTQYVCQDCYKNVLKMKHLKDLGKQELHEFWKGLEKQ